MSRLTLSLKICRYAQCEIDKKEKFATRAPQCRSRSLDPIFRIPNTHVRLLTTRRISYSSFLQYRRNKDNKTAVFCTMLYYSRDISARKINFGENLHRTEIAGGKGGILNKYKFLRVSLNEAAARCAIF